MSTKRYQTPPPHFDKVDLKDPKLKEEVLELLEVLGLGELVGAGGFDLDKALELT